MKQAVWILMTLALGHAEIIDRVVAVVGREVVLQSDLDREGRLEAFFGAATPVPAQVLERLLRQRLLFQEMEQTAPPEVSPEQARKWIEQMRPAGKDPSRQGLREADRAIRMVVEQANVRPLVVRAKRIDCRQVYAEPLGRLPSTRVTRLHWYYAAFRLPRAVCTPRLFGLYVHTRSAVVGLHVEQELLGSHWLPC